MFTKNIHFEQIRIYEKNISLQKIAFWAFFLELQNENGI